MQKWLNSKACNWKNFWSLLSCIAFTAGSIRLLNGASHDSSDFHVYWKAVHAWFAGTDPYVIRKEDLGFVFKYPPWMLPLLFPLQWWPFEFSKGVWAVAELLALLYCGRWFIRHRISPLVSVLTIFLYWYMWLAHFFSGQITVFLLVASLWAIERTDHKNTQDFRATLLITLLSTKIFSLIPILGLWRQWLRPRVLVWTGLLWVSLHLILWAIACINAPQSLGDYLLTMYQHWGMAAASGSAELGAIVVRGHGNHGFVAGILRWIDPDALHQNFDVGLSFILAVVLGFVWNKYSVGLRLEEKWAGWMAYGLIVHPLAWHHSFILALPLSAYSLQAAVTLYHSSRKSWRQTQWVVLALLGTALITLLVPQVVGIEWVKGPEAIANKSWGVLLCSWVLVRCSAHNQSNHV